MIDFAFVHTLLSRKIIDLPVRTIFSGRRAFLQICIPLITRTATFYFTLSIFLVEMRTIGRTLTRIISSNVRSIRLAFIDAFAFIETINLRNLTGSIESSATQEFYIPFLSFRTTLLFTHSSGFVEDRLLRKARTCIIFWVIGMIGFTLFNTTFSFEDKCLIF